MVRIILERYSCGASAGREAGSGPLIKALQATGDGA
jgi:hypothetical protein